MTLGDQRHLFDLPEEVVYLNCASQGPAPIAARDAGRRAVDRKARPWEPERLKLAAEMTRARELFAGFLGAGAGDIALTGATSYAMAVAAANLEVGRGRSIVLLEGQFPSNFYVWQRLAARDGARLVPVPRPGDDDWTSAVLERIGPDTGLVTLPNFHWTDGTAIDLVSIAAAVHAQGAALVIDATQSVGACPFDVGRIDPDFVACSAYKWLLSPDACGYLYVAPRRQNGEPIEHNHVSRIEDAPVSLSAGYGERLRPDASRFDQGAADAMIHLPMAVAAMEQIEAWGVEAIASTLAPLVDRIAGEAEARGWRVPPKAHRAPHFVGIRLPDPPAADLAERLAAEGIHVSLRDARIRVSPHLFNAPSEIDRLFAALDRQVRRAA